MSFPRTQQNGTSGLYILNFMSYRSYNLNFVRIASSTRLQAANRKTKNKGNYKTNKKPWYR